MSDHGRTPRRKNPHPGEELYQARITTKTAEQMLAILKDRPLELVGRGPHRLADGTFAAEVIARKRVLEKLPQGDWEIEIRKPRGIKDREGQVGKGNRYAEEGSFPRGVGVKE